uniref:Stromal cell derived factor 4 n=1 Tax=Astyanax mexicanus TaxID=7994 RepID=A0A8B9JHQ7_ASTMX
RCLPCALSGRLSVASLVLLIFLAVNVNARPANTSYHKEKIPNSKETNEILPPDHLNGVKMEMDGHLNKDFHQEVFLGKEMEEFEEDSEPRKNRKKLIEIFSKVDFNKDRSVSAKEMQRWIMEKTEEHFQEAVKENKLSFRAVDPDGDGHVTWDEYRVKFLASKGFNEKEVAEKIKNNEELKVDEESNSGGAGESEGSLVPGGVPLLPPSRAQQRHAQIHGEGDHQRPR